MVINGIDGGLGISGISRPLPSAGANEAVGSADGFTKVLGEMVNKVNGEQLEANKAIDSFVTGESKGLHEVMIAMEKSSISFQFLSQVRNKALDAYHEIMRMQV
jgi:flagellar hook-basal body complex protein FliE